MNNAMNSFCEKIHLTLSEDPLDALGQAATALKAMVPKQGFPIPDDQYKDICETYGFVTSLAREVKDQVGFFIGETQLGTQRENYLGAIKSYSNQLVSTVKGHQTKRESEAAFSRGRAFFSDRFAPPLMYVFSDSDISKINDLINDLRRLVVYSTDFSEAHRQRLLRRLDALQAEVRKENSNLDRVWGVAGEVWMTVKAFISTPEKADEWMNVIAKLLAIVAAAQAMAHGLPGKVVEMLPWLGGQK